MKISKRAKVIIVALLSILAAYILYNYFCSNKGKLVNVCNVTDKPICHNLYVRCEYFSSFNTDYFQPTIIFESGFRNDSDVWTVSHDGQTPVYQNVLKFGAKVCAYDRPGTIGWDTTRLSRSEDVEMPRDVRSMVLDLKLLLETTQKHPPYIRRLGSQGLPRRKYIFVGHSLGGLLMRLFASQHPNEVYGMVLVDAFSEYLREYLPVTKWQNYQKFIEEPIPDFIDKNLEQINFNDASNVMANAQKISPLKNIPLIVIARGQPSELPLGIGITTKELEAAWRLSQIKLASLSKRSKFIIAEKSSHYVQFFQPELVISSIKEILLGIS